MMPFEVACAECRVLRDDDIQLGTILQPFRNIKCWPKTRKPLPERLRRAMKPRTFTEHSCGESCWAACCCLYCSCLPCLMLLDLCPCWPGSSCCEGTGNISFGDRVICPGPGVRIHGPGFLEEVDRSIADQLCSLYFLYVVSKTPLPSSLAFRLMEQAMACAQMGTSRLARQMRRCAISAWPR